MSNTKDDDGYIEIELTPYSATDATRPGTARGAIRATAAAVQEWTELASHAAQRAQLAAAQGLDLAARIESQIVEICVYEALKTAKTARKVG